MTIVGTSFVAPVVVTIDNQVNNCTSSFETQIVCAVPVGSGKSHFVSLSCGIPQCGLQTVSSWSYAIPEISSTSLLTIAGGSLTVSKPNLSTVN